MERRSGKNFFTLAQNDLENFYDALPHVSCTSCGKCCASPHITYAEALHLFAWLFESKLPEDLERMFNAETIEQTYVFNFKCRFENSETKMCEVHPARGFICRVFGYPVLDRMGIENMDNCHEPDRTVIPNVRLSRMHEWMDHLASLNRAHVQDFNRAPYHITGFNIETWLDIAVTDYGRHPFTLYHEELNALPFGDLNLTFSDRTSLSTRLAKIDLFHQALRHRNTSHAGRLIENLLTSEPMTGTFFRYEAKRYRSRL